MSNIKTKTELKISVEVPGSHCYPESDNLYLQNPHRHNFLISVFLEVTDLNREIEFYDFAAKIYYLLTARFKQDELGTYDFETNSCEHLADWLLWEFNQDGFNVTKVEVAEDRYNSATVRRA
jgi:6-pyruvoyl-tetrahydropterin synthase